MYDTLIALYPDSVCLNQAVLSNSFEKIDKQTGLYLYTESNLENLKVRQYYTNIIIMGSIAKYLLGNNLETLCRKNIKEAIESISDNLHFNFKDSKIFRLDVATNFIMNEQYKKYLISLGDLQYFNKSNFNDSVYYINSKKQIIFL